MAHNLRHPGLVGLAACLVAALTPAASAQIFTNVTTAAGITHNAVRPNQQQSATSEQAQAGGAAAGDFDGDGWVDLYVSRFFDTDVLYHNNGDGTFSDVTTAAFPSGLGAISTSGAAWGDIDNDGDLDLYVAGLDEYQHFLYINDGTGQFTEQAVTRGAGVGDGSRTMTGTSPAFGDYDNDGYLDIYVTEWHGFAEDANPSNARLLHNLGAANPGHFEDLTLQAGVSMDVTTGPFANHALSFTPRFTDLDRDGYQDLAVISDGHTSRLFWNNGDGTFTDGTTPVLTTGTNDMGFSVGDVNGDGLLDWFATSIYDDSSNPTGNHLYLNNGDRTFTDVTEEAGVRVGGWGWGTDMFDFDNDADLDIVMTNGFVIAPVDRSRLFVNDGTGVFTESAIFKGIVDTGQGRGLLTFDYDQDGDLDLFIVNFDSAPILYRNDGGDTAGNWLQIKTVGTLSNRDGVGAFITITPDLTQPEVFYVTEIDGSSNYLAQSEMIAHFGLGDLESIDQIVIEWIATNTTQVVNDVGVNQRITIVETLVSLLTGDADNDGDVDADDLAMVRSHFGKVGLDHGYMLGDANDDGRVDAFDLLAIERNFGALLPLSGDVASIPEPTTAALLALGALAALPRPRR